MKITTNIIQQLMIDDVAGLDPVRVMWEDYQPGQGRITITCYGRAWTTAWFAMAGAEIRVFFMSASPEYVLSNLVGNMAPGLKRNQRSDEAYLLRIIIAVQEAFRRQVREELHGEAP